MESILRTCRTMGFCRCFPQLKKKSYNSELLKKFLVKKLPIFWVIGPRGLETQEIAHLLQMSSNFHLINIGNLLHQEIEKGKLTGQTIDICLKTNKPIPDEICIEVIKEHILATFVDVKGYIICDFPTNLNQAKLFEMDICKVNIVIYYTYNDADRLKKAEEKAKGSEEDFFIVHKRYAALNKRYENKLLKITTDKTTQENLTVLINDLDKYWGYKFIPPNVA